MISSQEKIADDEDDQLFYTKIFLNEETRNKWSIVLDKRADIFMNLNGAADEIELPAKDDEVYIHNTWTDSIPTVIHGNGPAKVSSRKLSVVLIWTDIFCLAGRSSHPSGRKRLHKTFIFFFSLENFELFK